MYSYITSRMVLGLIQHFQDREVVGVWDKESSYRRKALYQDYKKKPPIDKSTLDGQKKAKELESYAEARTWLHTNLPRMGVQSLMVPGIEGDDIAYFLVEEKYPELNAGLETKNYLISEDKDWIQIITDYWALYRPLKNETITCLDVAEKFQTREKFIYRKALLGDRSDNIPKCYQMGEAKVDRYCDLLLAGKNYIDKSAISYNLRDFIDSGQFTKNLQLIDFKFLCRGERKKLHIEYDNSLQKVNLEPNLLTWIELANQIDSSNMINFGSYLQW
jgi:hypothetical protein